MKERSYALPKSMYGDPADNVDMMRKMRVEVAKQDARDKLRKGRKVRAAVKKAKNKGGGK